MYEAGIAALGAGHYDQAREFLARAIALDPDQPAAWLDLALAARGEGDAAFADDILQMMVTRFGVPSHLTVLVDQLRDDLDRSLLKVHRQNDIWTLHSRFSVALGHDSNANSGLAIAALALTFPEGSFSLPINPALQRRSDQFLSSNLSLLAQGRFAWGVLEPSLRLRIRENFSVNGFDTYELGGGIGWLLPQDTPEDTHRVSSLTRFSLASQTIRLGGRGLLNSSQIGAEHQWDGDQCAPGAGLSLDDRTFPNQGGLDSRLWWASARVVCATSFARLPGRAQFQLRQGLEKAKEPFNYFAGTGRTGGDTRHLEASLLYLQRTPAWLGAGRLEAEAVYGQTKDTQGYSMLLENNAQRLIHRQTFSLAYSIPIESLSTGHSGRQVEFNLIWQAFRQRSNLEIFRTQAQQISAGVSVFW